MNTKITKNLLIEKKVSKDFIEYFQLLNMEEITIDNLLIQIKKDKKNYSYWLFITFNLSGLCEEFYEGGNTLARCNYKNGKLHGLCEKFYGNGNIMGRCNYENDKLIN